MEPMLAYERLDAAHPDWVGIVNDEVFQDWLIPRYGDEIHPDQMIAILDIYKAGGTTQFH